MAESACLRRSFSHPSHELSEGDPLRALGESVSFGKYMSESLAWEKWSTFSHNRYLEEAEKSSKPGSVAKMKAYFEAHHRRIGAKKQADQEQAYDESPSAEPKVEHAPHVELLSSSPTLNSETEIATSNPSIHEFPTKDNTEDIVSRVSVSSGDSPVQRKELLNEEASTVESGANADTMERSLEVQTYDCDYAGVSVGSSVSSADIKVHQCRHALVSDILLSTPERNITVKKKSLDSTSKQKSADTSNKRSKKGNVSKLSSSLSRLATPVRSKKDGNYTPKKGNVSMLSSSLARLATPVCPKKEGNYTPKNGNVSKLSSSLSRLATPVRPKKEVNGTPNNRKSEEQSVEKKKPTMNSVHMSIHVNSEVSLLKKPSPSSHKTGVGKVFTPLGKIIKGSYAPSPTATRTKVNSIPRHPSATPQSETKRSRVALENSFARDTTLDQKMKSPSVVDLKSSIRSPITFSTFGCRTAERAAKRKEFFQKRLEMEAENLQLIDKAKVKPTADSRKSSQCPNAMIRTEVLSNSIKIPTSRSQLPKCEFKPASELVQGKCSRPPQRAASLNSKPLATTLLMKKRRQENASPNIL